MTTTGDNPFGTPIYNTPQSSVTTSTFKPDFTQTNPYAGVDIDYIKTVAKVYIPTIAQPLNPIQTAAIAGQLPSNLATQPVVINLTPAQQNITGVAKLTETPQAIVANFNPDIPITTVSTNVNSNVPPPITAINGVTLTGNIMTDLDNMKAANSKPADIITLLNSRPDFNWNNISIEQQQYLSPIVSNFNQNIGNYLKIGNEVIQKDDYSKLSPQVQLEKLQTAKLIDGNAKLAVNPDGTPKLDDKGNWQYTTGKVTTTIIAPAVTTTQTTQQIDPKELNDWVSKLNPIQLSVYNAAGGNIEGVKAVDAAYKIVLQDLEPYKISQSVDSGYVAEHGGQVGDYVSYNLASAVKNGVSLTSLLAAGFTMDAITGAKTVINAQDKLAPYAQVVPLPYSIGISGASSELKTQLQPASTQTLQTLAKFQLTNPDDTQTLKDAGYGDDTINAVNQYVGAVNKNIAQINIALSDRKGTESGYVTALIDAIENAGYYKAGLTGVGGAAGTQLLSSGLNKQLLTSQDIAKKQWDVLSDTQKAEVAGLYSEDLSKSNPFAELTKQEAEIAEKTGLAGGLVYGIPLAIQQPVAKQSIREPSIQYYKAQGLSDAEIAKLVNVTPMEWAIAAATAATIVLPLVAPAVESALVGTEGALVAERTVAGVEAASTGVFATNIVQNWNKMDAAEKILNVGMLAAAPVGKALGDIGLTGSKTTDIYTNPEGIPPSGLKTGGLDVAFVEVPDHFFKGLSESQLKDIYLDKALSGAEKITKIAGLMTPETSKAFLDITSLAQDVSKYKIPESKWNTPEVTFASVEGMNQPAANELAIWARNNPDAIFVGSVSDKAQGFNLTPGDFDIDIPNGSQERVVQVKTEVQDIISRNGATASVDAHTQGAFGALPYGWEKIAPDPITNDGVKFLAMGKQVLNLTQVITAPAIGERSAGLMSPAVFEIGGETLPKNAFQPEVKVGTHAGTLDKILRTETEFQQIIDDIRTNDPVRADVLQPKLDSYVNYINEMKKGNLQPIDVADALRLKQQFLDMVGNADQIVLTQGKEAIVYDPESGGTLTRRVVPVSEVVTNTIYSATKDYTPFLDAQRAGEKITVGTMYGIEDGQLVIPEDMTSLRRVYETSDGATILDAIDISGAKIMLDANKMPVVNENGFVKATMPDGTDLWINKGEADSITRTISNGVDAGKYIAVTFGTQDAPRQQMFFSLEVAFDKLRDPITGKLMPKAGIIALRTTPIDTAMGSESIGRPFRYEYDANGNPIVYSEKVAQLDSTINSTKPTGLSLSGKGVSDGLTGETVTYDPRTKTDIPMLWFATDSAKDLGLGAPTIEQMNAIKWLAFKSMITDLAHPHINTDVNFSFGESGGTKGSLLTFDRDTYQWREGVKSANEVVNRETEQITKEATDNLKTSGRLKGLSDSEIQTAIQDESTRIYNERVKEVLNQQDIMKELVNESGKNIADSYTLNVKQLLDNVSTESMIVSAASNIGGTAVNKVSVPVSQQIGDTQEVITSITEPSITTIKPITTETITETSVPIVSSEIPVTVKETITPPISEVKISETTPVTKVVTETQSPIVTPIITPPIVSKTPPVTKEPSTTPPKETVGTIPITITTTTPPTTIPSTVVPTIINEPTNKPPIKVVLPITFNDDGDILEKLKYGFITWRQGKTYWAIPQLEDGSFNTNDKVASGKPFRGTTKFFKGKGSVYATIQYVGQHPPEKAFIDIGWAQFNVVKDGNDVKITKIEPDDTANWEGVNGYTKVAEEKAQEQQYQEWRAKYTGKADANVHVVPIRPFKESPPEMQKEVWPDYSEKDGSTVKVFKVSGKYIRENLDPDFTQGGHWLVYEYIPKDEIWIEKMAEPEEEKFTLGHELDEVHSMETKGDSYHDAHTEAVALEFNELRKNPDSVDEEINEQLEKFTPEEIAKQKRIAKYKKQYMKPRKHADVFKETDEVLSKRKQERPETPVSSNKRTYFGYEILPSDVGGNL